MAKKFVEHWHRQSFELNNIKRFWSKYCQNFIANVDSLFFLKLTNWKVYENSKTSNYLEAALTKLSENFIKYSKL